MVKSFATCVETGGFISQTLPAGQLRKGQADRMLTTPKMPNLALGILALEQSGKRLAIHQIEDLGEDVATRIHGHRSSLSDLSSSNAWHLFWVANHSS
jgi:hypothetical protein